MKRTVRILALVLLLAMVATVLLGCVFGGNKLSGTYEHTDKDGQISLLVFDGDEFVYTLGTTQLKGTYEIKKEGSKKYIVLQYDETVVNGGKVNKLDKPLYIGAQEGNPLVITDEYITIGSGTDLTRYNKK